MKTYNKNIYGIGFPSKYAIPEKVILQPLSLKIFNNQIKYNNEVYDIDNIDNYHNGEIAIYTNKISFLLIRQIDHQFGYMYVRNLTGISISFNNILKLSKWIQCFLDNHKYISDYDENCRIVAFYLIKYLYDYEHKTYTAISQYFDCNKSTIMRSYQENRPLNYELSNNRVDMHSDFANVIIALTNKGE